MANGVDSVIINIPLKLCIKEPAANPIYFSTKKQIQRDIRFRIALS